MTDFADQVARALHRRMRRRRLVMLAAAAAIIAFAVYFVTCGHGFGLGGTGKGSGVAARATDAGPHRCIVRVTASGYVLDGKSAASSAAVVTACRATAGAEVTVTGDARQGNWDELRTALDAAHVAILVKRD
jgi:hypothetical protein